MEQFLTIKFGVSADSERADESSVQASLVLPELSADMVDEVVRLVGMPRLRDAILDFAQETSMLIAVHMGEAPNCLEVVTGSQLEAEPGEALRRLAEGVPLLLVDRAVVMNLGEFLFWNVTPRGSVFRSTNPDLRSSLYFPAQLARDGAGLFIDERIVHRLKGLQFIPADFTVVHIEDLGGWKSISDLTAAIEVVAVSPDGRRNAAKLFGSAIIWTSSTVEGEQRRVRAVHRALQSSGIPTTVLDVTEGVVYHRECQSLRDALKSAGGDDRLRLLSGIALACAILDEDDSLKSIGEPAFVPASVEDDFPKLVDCLGWNGEAVCWAAPLSDPRLVVERARRNEGCWVEVSSLLSPEEVVKFYPLYRATASSTKLNPDMRPSEVQDLH